MKRKRTPLSGEPYSKGPLTIPYLLHLIRSDKVPEGAPAWALLCADLLDALDKAAQRPEVQADSAVMSEVTVLRRVIGYAAMQVYQPGAVEGLIVSAVSRRHGAQNARRGSLERLNALAHEYLAQPAEARKEFARFVEDVAEQAGYSQSRVRTLLREHHGLPAIY